MQTTIENVSEEQVKLSERESFIADLRSAADFFEQHPELRTPSDARIDVWARTKAEMSVFLRASGHVEKHYLSDWVFLRKTMPNGLIRVEFNGNREQVCERIVTGTKVVPAHVLPAQPETEVPEKVEEIVEWRCHPLLEGGAV